MTGHPAPAQPEQSAIDADLDAVRIGKEVRASGGLHTLSGLLAFLGGVQVAGTIHFRSDAAGWVPYIFMVSGLIALFSGTLTYRGKASGAILATVLAGLHVLGGAGWFMMLLGMGVGSMPVMLTPALAFAAFMLGAYVLPRVLRIDAARKRLAASGLSFGV